MLAVFANGPGGKAAAAEDWRFSGVFPRMPRHGPDTRERDALE